MSAGERASSVPVSRVLPPICLRGGPRRAEKQTLGVLAAWVLGPGDWPALLVRSRRGQGLIGHESRGARAAGHLNLGLP
jgi:hypothetical protein